MSGPGRARGGTRVPSGPYPSDQNGLVRVVVPATAQAAVADHTAVDAVYFVCAAAENITDGDRTVDGVTVVNGDRVLRLDAARPPAAAGGRRRRTPSGGGAAGGAGWRRRPVVPTPIVARRGAHAHRGGPCHLRRRVGTVRRRSLVAADQRQRGCGSASRGVRPGCDVRPSGTDPARSAAHPRGATGGTVAVWCVPPGRAVPHGAVVRPDRGRCDPSRLRSAVAPTGRGVRGRTAGGDVQRPHGPPPRAVRPLDPRAGATHRGERMELDVRPVDGRRGGSVQRGCVDRRPPRRSVRGSHCRVGSAGPGPAVVGAVRTAAVSRGGATRAERISPPCAAAWDRDWRPTRGHPSTCEQRTRRRRARCGRVNVDMGGSVLVKAFIRCGGANPRDAPGARGHWSPTARSRR